MGDSFYTYSVKTILVVDDDELIRKLVTAALSKRGWTVLEAEDGVDGIARFMLHRPDVILTDISMPKSDGLEMIRTLRQSNGLDHTRVVIMSGVISVTDNAITAAKADALLSKPFTLQDLYVAVGA